MINMKKTNLIFLFCASLALGACHFESFDERCEREAKEYTQKQCPRRLDKCTVVDSMVYDKSTHTLSYYYTLEGLLDDEQVMTDKVFDNYREQLLKNVVNSIELKAYKEKELNFSYYYYSKKTGKQRFTLTFTPEDYGTGNNKKDL